MVNYCHPEIEGPNSKDCNMRSLQKIKKSSIEIMTKKTSRLPAQEPCQVSDMQVKVSSFVSNHHVYLHDRHLAQVIGGCHAGKSNVFF